MKSSREMPRWCLTSHSARRGTRFVVENDVSCDNMGSAGWLPSLPTLSHTAGGVRVTYLSLRFKRGSVVKSLSSELVSSTQSPKKYLTFNTTLVITVRQCPRTRWEVQYKCNARRSAATNCGMGLETEAEREAFCFTSRTKR